MFRIIFIVLVVAVFANGDKRKWISNKINRVCSQVGSDLHSKSSNACIFFKVINATERAERQKIFNCLVDDKLVISDDFCKKWWQDPHSISSKNTPQNGIENYIFANIVKHVINQAERCIFKLDSENSVICERFNLRDQEFVDHCYLNRPVLFTNRKVDYKCIGIASGSHFNGFTMSNERRNRISSLWKKKKENDQTCIGSNCFKKEYTFFCKFISKTC
ncbi:hypothetical protein BLOT_009344 [Blomia tropicalis]|nr:hypothetical protein BLOT_009344 [Blomia tropicalis]